ncbi:hypothetical protein OCU04_011973 [Sclerotinia nivalis]|uniref:Uncharacterized protein n=1 Tax=Sclerotinia nivalis TaxID=352851 RepID=A0A9X0AA74_9HELO|nr:hypothetical protein OCU04_011973 [Sclerotinia nivalis]
MEHERLGIWDRTVKSLEDVLYREWSKRNLGGTGNIYVKERILEVPWMKFNKVVLTLLDSISSERSIFLGCNIEYMRSEWIGKVACHLARSNSSANHTKKSTRAMISHEITVSPQTMHADRVGQNDSDVYMFPHTPRFVLHLVIYALHGFPFL